jgi:hypothetical protein
MKIPGEYNVYALGEMKAENVSVSLLVKLRLYAPDVVFIHIGGALVKLPLWHISATKTTLATALYISPTRLNILTYSFAGTILANIIGVDIYTLNYWFILKIFIDVAYTNFS